MATKAAASTPNPAGGSGVRGHNLAAAGSLSLDKSLKKSDKETVAELERQLPNFPLVYMLDKKGYHYKNKTCAKAPTIYDVHVNNIYWQETETSNGTFYLYGAYLDVRKNNRLGPTVRILGKLNICEHIYFSYILLIKRDRITAPMQLFSHMNVHF